MATREEREAEDRERNKQAQAGQTDKYDEQQRAEAAKQAEARDKARKEYSDGLNKKVGDLFNFVGQSKDPNDMKYGISALKDAASQLEAAYNQQATKAA